MQHSFVSETSFIKAITSALFNEIFKMCKVSVKNFRHETW